MRRSTLIGLFVAVVAALAIAGCGDGGGEEASPPAPNCGPMADGATCSSGETCVSGYCNPSCTENSECGEGETCFAGGCVTECSAGSDCKETETCSYAGVCWSASEEAREPCERDLDCTFDEYCGNNSCQPASCEEDADCEGANICVTQQGDQKACETGCRSGSDVPDRLTCPDGQVCNAQNQCESAGCEMGECGAHRYCDMDQDPATCEYDQTCPTDDPEFAQAVCNAYQAQIDSDINHVCNDNGMCVEQDPCQDDGDCGDGEICQEVQDGRNFCRTGCRCTDASETEGCVRGCDFGEFCNLNQFTCVDGCTSDAECGQDQVCLDDENICQGTCDTDEDCQVDGLQCTGDPRICRPCTPDGPVTCDAGEICDVEEYQEENSEVGVCVPEPPPCPDDAYGTNHCKAQAYDLSGNLPFSGAPTYCRENAGGSSQVCDPLDDEWFKIEVPDGVVLTATLTYPNEVMNEATGEMVSTGNLDLVAYPAIQGDNIDPIAQSTRAPVEDNVEGETFSREALEVGVTHGESSPQPYYVQVRGTVTSEASPIDYDLEIDYRQPTPCSSMDDSFEDNETIDNAVPLPEDTAHTGLHVCGDDVDWYLLDAKANQIITATAQAPARLGNVNLELYPANTADPSTTPPLDEARSSQTAETVQHENTEPGQFALKVYLADPIAPSQSGVGNAEYNLTWSQKDNPCADQFEPNNLCGSDLPELNNSTRGNSATFTDVPVCQTPGTLGEGDYYRFNLDSLDSLSVTITYNQMQQQGQLQAALYGPNDCLNFISDATRQTLSNGDTELSFNIPSSEIQIGGDYWVQVSIFGSNAEVLYDLSYNITPGPVCVQDEFDSQGSSNDSYANATTLSASNIKSGGDQSVYNRLQICSGDQDWFCTQLDAAQNSSIEYQVRFDHDNGVGDLDAFLEGPVQSGGGGRTQLDASTSSTDDETVSISNIQQSGEYCVNVQGGTSGIRNAYDLLTFVDGQGNPDPQCPDNYENNDQCSSLSMCTASTNFPIGPTQTDLLYCPNDPDFYQVSVDAGEQVTANLQYDKRNGFIGMQVYESFDVGSAPTYTTPQPQNPNDNIINKVLSWESTRQQNYYVEVFSNTAVTNYYDLKIDKTSVGPCTDDSYDTGGSSNDNSSNAVEMSSPGLEVGRRICDSNEDWYKFDIGAGNNFQVFANYDYDVGDVDITVYGPGGTSTQVGSSTSTNDDESVTVINPAGGTYYVKVATKVPARVDYDLLVYEDLNDNNTIEPALGEGPEDKSCPDQFEDNDTPAQAPQIGVTNFDRLTMCAENGDVDKDYYEIYLPEDAQLTADLQFTHAEGDIDMTLYEGTDTSGTVIGSSTSDDDGENISMSSPSTGSTYLLEVTGDTGTSGSNFRNMYSMDLSVSFSGSCTEDTFGEGNDPDPNHSQSTAEPLSAQDYDGSFDLTLCEDSGGSPRADWFEFTITSSNAGNPALFSLDHTAAQGEIQMELINKDGTGNNQVVATSSPLFSVTDNVQEIDMSSLSADTYWLKISSVTGSPIRNAYDLWAEFGGSAPTQPYCPDRYERNDSSDDGTPAPLNYPTSYTFVDSTVCGGERDWFTADLQSGTTYRFETYFEHTASSDLNVQIFNPNGSLATHLKTGMGISFAAGSDTDDELSPFVASSSGTYKFGIDNAGSAAVSAPFQLTTESMYSTGSPSSDCPSDIAGSTKSLAPAVGSSLPYTNGFGLCSSDDFVRWTAPSTIPSDVRVTVYHDNTEYTNASLTTLNFGLLVEEQNGGVVADDPAPASFSNATRDNRATGTFSPTAGETYFINIQRGNAPNTSDSTHGPYILEIKWVNP